MEVDCKSQDEHSSNYNQIDERLEYSTTDESSEVYSYYPSLEVLNTTKKIKSRLGKGGRRRTTLSAFRMSADITDSIDETNHSISNNSTENSCSDVISRDIAVCPSVAEKVDFLPNKDNAALAQESCPVPPSEPNFDHRGLRNFTCVSEKMTVTPKKILNNALLDQENCPNVERRSFRNVSNSIHGNNYKLGPTLFQEKSSDINKTDSIQDFLYVPVTEQKIPPVLQITNNPMHKTPLKQTNDNIFTSSATKVNHLPVRQSNPVKNLVSKFSADNAKENVPSPFDYSKTNKKQRDIFSTAYNEKNAASALKKAESFSGLRSKQSEVSLPHKTLSKVTSLNDLPLDLKMKFKPEIKKEPLSMKTAQESPPFNVLENPFKGPSAPAVMRPCNTSPQKLVASDGCVAETKPPPDTRLLAQEIFKKPSAFFPLNVPSAELFKKPAQPLPLSGSSSGIPVAVSQPLSLNSNSILPKLNIQPTKQVYSFASDMAKYCQKESGTKLTMLKNPQQPTPSNDQVIKVNDRSYHIMGTIGKGGSSEVYQVLVPGSKTTLAVKVVKLASVDEVIADGYMNEVKLLEKLQGCMSVVRMFDYEYIQESKKLYVVMEKGDTDLSRLLKDINKTKKIPMHVITYFWIEMLTAVQEIHEKGIIHSDLKPANFLLVSGRLKLIDFGIASSLQGDMTSVQKDICAGTENYISPEAIQDGTGSNDKKYKISYKSDVWSLGCILYNLIYGKTPFSHITSRWGKMFAIVSSSHKIDFPNVPMPRVLRQALQSCLIRDPKQRPSVKDLLELPYLPEDNSPTITSDLPFKIQQLLPEEQWRKIAHLFPEPMKPNVAQGK